MRSGPADPGVLDPARVVLFRADGSSAIGMGHVMRCIGLAQEFMRRGYRPVFAVADDVTLVRRRLELEGIDCVALDAPPASEADLAAFRSVGSELEPYVIVLDGYDFVGAWWTDLHDVAPVMTWVDYPPSESIPVDILLDQNPSADEERYRRAAPNALILSGLDYAVLRSELLHRPGIRRTRSRIERVLVTIGGADPLGMTPEIVKCLRAIDRAFALDVVVGPASRTMERVREQVEGFAGCRLHHAVADMGELIAPADLAISATGIALWEFAFSGLPTLGFSVSDNQDPSASALGRSGGGVNLGRGEDFRPDQLERALTELYDQPARLTAMSQAMLDWVDGRGAQRVVDAIESRLGRRDRN